MQMVSSTSLLIAITLFWNETDTLIVAEPVPLTCKLTTQARKTTDQTALGQPKWLALRLVPQKYIGQVNFSLETVAAIVH